jgi:uncharacterized membrane protein
LAETDSDAVTHRVLAFEVDAMPTRQLIETALFTALCVSLGYMLAGVPNVEILSACVFTSGVLLGPRRGTVVGGLAELLYAGLNPYGLAPLPLLASQVLAMAVIGASGGFFPRFAAGSSWKLQAGLAAVAGFVLTLCFDLLTNAASFLLVRESAPFVPYMIAGLSFPFPLAHALGNTVSFALVVPAVRRAAQHWRAT